MEMVSNGSQPHPHKVYAGWAQSSHPTAALQQLEINAYKSADVFIIDELKALCAQSAVTIEIGKIVLVWRDILGAKYSDLPGVQKLHDFSQL